MTRHPVLTRLRDAPARFRRALRWSVLRRGAVEALILQAVLLPGCAVLAALYPDEPAWLRAAAATWALWAWPPLRMAAFAGFASLPRRRGPDAIAAELDRLNPEAPDVFRTARRPGTASPRDLDALEALFASWESRLRVPSPPAALARGSVRRAALRGAAVFAAAALSLPAVMPERFGSPTAVVRRALVPLRVLDGIPASRLRALSLPAAVASGDTLIAFVRAEHVPRRRAVHAVVRRDETGSGETRHPLVRTGDTAIFRFGPVTRDLSIRFSTTGFLSDRFRVRVVAPPRLRRLSVVVTPPAYSGLPRERFAEVPPVLSVLPGTRIAWEGDAGPSLRTPVVLWTTPGRTGRGGNQELRDGEERASAIDAEDGVFAFARTVREPGAFSLRLIGREPVVRPARAVEGPWRLEVRRDELPEVVLVAPSGAAGNTGDGLLPRSLRVALRFRVADDYGLSRVVLRHAVRTSAGTVRAEGTHDVTSWPRAPDGAAAGVWDAAALRPAPGETVELSIEAFDNDVVSGPKSARSETARLRVPTPEEARALVAERERAAQASLASAAARARLMERETARAIRPDEAASEEPVTAASQWEEWEVRRILVEEPRRILRELGSQLVREAAARRTAPEPRQGTSPDAARAEATTATPGKEGRESEKALEDLRREVARQERNLPSSAVAAASPAEQRRASEERAREQQALARALERTPPPGPDETRAAGQLGANRERLENDLSRNLRDQKDLQGFLKERERAEEARRERLDAAARQAEELTRDVREAIEELEQALRAGLDDGSIEDDVVDKMDRVRELLEEVLDEDEKERLGRAAESATAETGQEDLQQALRDVRKRQDALGEDLDRAISMLEELAAQRALRRDAEDLRALEQSQGALAALMQENERAADPNESEGGVATADSSLARVQDSLAARLEDIMESLDKHEARAGAGKNSEDGTGKDDMRASSPGTPREMTEAGEASARPSLEQARADMEKARRALSGKKPDRSAARRNAEQAARRLGQTAARMEQAVMQSDPGAAKAEARAVLDETLEMARALEMPLAQAGDTPAFGLDDPRAAARVAAWLAARMTRLADAHAFETEVLRREASTLAARAASLADGGGSPWSIAERDGMLRTARRAARELLKLMDSSDGSGGGDQAGDEGAGDVDAGGGGQGTARSEGQEGSATSLSGRLHGISGSQMAASRMTQELLRSMLQERREASGGSRSDQGTGRPGNAGDPSPGSASSSGFPEGSRDGARPSGTRSGHASGDASGDASGNTPGNTRENTGADARGTNGSGRPDEAGEGPASGPAAATAQQSVADLLETLAEAAGDAGGAARRLRELAAEARALERELRGSRPDPASLRARQARFRTRLLEAADALEERGTQSARRAEAPVGPIPLPDDTAGMSPDERAAALTRRREEALALPLTRGQKRRVEWYYDELEGRWELSPAKERHDREP